MGPRAGGLETKNMETMIAIIAVGVTLVVTLVGAAWRLSNQLADLRVQMAKLQTQLAAVPGREWVRRVVAEELAEHRATCPGREPTGVLAMPHGEG